MCYISFIRNSVLKISDVKSINPQLNNNFFES